MTDSPAPKHRRSAARVRLAPAAVIAGVAASAAIAMSMTGTLGAFTAQIINSTNNAATGYLTMQETGSASTGGASVVCNSTDSTTLSNNSATCATINKYGGGTTLVPGGSVSTSFTIKNTGSVPANTFTLAPGACSQTTSPAAPTVNGSTASGTATDLCSKITLAATETIGSGSAQTVVNGTTLATLGTGGTVTLNGPIPAGTVATFNFTLTFASSGSNATDNTYQALQARQQLTWTFLS